MNPQRARLRLLVLLAAAACTPIGRAAPPDSARPRAEREATLSPRHPWTERGVWLKAALFPPVPASVDPRPLAAAAARAGCDAVLLSGPAPGDAGPAAGWHRQVREAQAMHRRLVVIAGLTWIAPGPRGVGRGTVFFPPSADRDAQIAQFAADFGIDGASAAKLSEPAVVMEALLGLERAGVGSSAPVIVAHSLGTRARNPAELEQAVRAWRAVNNLLVGFVGGAPPDGAAHSRPLVDGTDPAVEVGDVWDRLLAGGVPFWGALAHSRLDGAPHELPAIWLLAAGRSETDILDALRAGAFSAVHGGIAGQVEFTVDAPGLERPAQAGETIRLTRGNVVRARLRYPSPTSGSAKANLVELIAVDRKGARIAASRAPLDGEFALEQDLPVSAGGMTLRLRGRRLRDGEPDEIFLTNPVRVELVRPAAADSRGRRIERRLGTASLVLTVLGLAAWLLRLGEGTARLRRWLWSGTARDQLVRLLAVYYFVWLVLTALPEGISRPWDEWRLRGSAAALARPFLGTPHEMLAGLGSLLQAAAACAPIGLLAAEWRKTRTARTKGPGFTLANSPPPAGRPRTLAAAVLFTGAGMLFRALVSASGLSIPEAAAMLGGAVLGAFVAERTGWTRDITSENVSVSIRAGRSLEWCTVAGCYLAFYVAACWWPFHRQTDERAARAGLLEFAALPPFENFLQDPAAAILPLAAEFAWIMPLGIILGFAVEVLIPGPFVRKLLTAGGMLFLAIVTLAVEVGESLFVSGSPRAWEALLRTALGTAALLATSRILQRRVAELAREAQVPIYDPVPGSERVRRVRTAALIAAVLTWTVLLLARPPHPAEVEAARRAARQRSLLARSGSVVSFLPSRPVSTPQVERIALAGVDGLPDAAAVLGALGRDDRGRIWIGVSARSADSAALVELSAERRPIVRGTVVDQLRRLDLMRPGEEQRDLPTQILQADDGRLYFASSDPAGDDPGRGRLPTWGSRLWSVDPDDPARWNAIAHLPDRVSALWGNGRWIYLLARGDHRLYQFDVERAVLLSQTVGSVPGHVSRQILVDGQGHVYVPRVQTGGGEGQPLRAELVEFDEKLREVIRHPLPNYGDDPAGPGIAAFHHLADGSILFATGSGFLLRLVPDPLEKSRLEPLGSFSGLGPGRVTGLFSWTGDHYVAGPLLVLPRPQWVVRDLRSGRSTRLPLSLPVETSQLAGTTLEGTHTADDEGGFYLGGATAAGEALLLRVFAP